MSTQSAHLFPALRARMEDWWYYITTMTFSEVARWVKPVDEIQERKELKTWIQRQVRPARRKQIASYLLNQKQHFFNAIVVGIYGGEPRWLPVDVGENPTHPELEPGEREKSAFGLLRLSGDEEIFAIDGQHRVEGIKEAIQQNPKLGDEEICVIFVGHKKTLEGRERTRRLFITLNKYARPVTKGEIIALSDDDSFAVVTRKLIDDYPGLGTDLVPLTGGTNIPTGDYTSLTTVKALYETIGIITVPLTATRGERKKWSEEREPPPQLDERYRRACAFWDALKANVPPIRKVCASRSEQNLVAAYRTAQGGNLLFRPLGLHAFAKAARVLMDRSVAIQRAVARLAKCELQLENKPWIDVLWNPHKKRMAETSMEKLAVNLFLHMVNETPFPTDFKTLNEYRRAIGRNDARLP